MDDGYWPFSFFLFFVFVMLEAAFYGFGSAIRNLNESNLEREAELGDEKAKKLLRFVNSPARFIDSMQIVSNTIGMVMGAYILKRWSQRLEAAIWQTRVLEGSVLRVASLLIIGVLLLVCVVSFGTIIPKRCGAREPEKWGYGLLPLISAMLVPLVPFIWLVSGLSFVVLKLCGIDMNTEEDNVTEEDIMSMVNEGHEQGVLAAIVKGFAGGAAQMASIGLNLIKGIWNGIGDAASWLWGKVSGFCSNLMSKIKGFFGIHSPSTEMAWVGEMLVEGLAGSIEDNGGEAVKAAEGLSDGISDVMNGLAEDMKTSIPTDFHLDADASVRSVTDGMTGAAGRDMSGFASLITIQQMIVRSEDDIRKISQELYNLIQTGSRAGGRIITA